MLPKQYSGNTSSFVNTITFLSKTFHKNDKIGEIP